MAKAAKVFECKSHHRRNKKTRGYQCSACKQRGVREERAKIVKAIRAMIHECPQCSCEPGIEQAIANLIEAGIY